MHSFHGNFFVRSPDLLALANVNPDAAIGVQVSLDENLENQSTVCFQAALLFTSSKGKYTSFNIIYLILRGTSNSCSYNLLAGY